MVAEHEFERSLDAFPFEFGDILSDHVVVSGGNPFDGLAVDSADLRRACEVQARGHLLHLREGYLETRGRADALAVLIVRSAPAFAALISSLARLEGQAHDDLGATARFAERVLGLTGTAATDIAALVGVQEISSADAERLFAPYLAAVERLVAFVDARRSSVRLLVAALLVALSVTGVAAAAADLPELTQPVNDFAHVIDPDNAAAIDQMIRALKAASGDVVVVATVPTIEPYGDIREYANKLFENHGRGIGDKGKDNGLLIVLALKERRVQVEVGYGLEQWITDGFAGETSRDYMAPAFREGRFGDGLRLGTARLIGRIAEGAASRCRVRVPAGPGGATVETPIPLSAHHSSCSWPILIVSRIAAAVHAGGIRRWGGGGWSGWSSGVGPFGGGWGGGFGGGGGGFGGGFGGFGGGGSGGGGGGSGW